LLRRWMMRFIALLLLTLVAALPGYSQDVVLPKDDVVLGRVNVNPALTHENLSVYILEDPKAKARADFITLEEGLRLGQVRVSEQQIAQVKELVIENASKFLCYVQAGDIVKGGHQDRALAADLIVPPHSGKIPVPSFCVEPGRWGTGMGGGFGTTTGQVVGARLRMAIQKEKNQQKVWDAVAAAKENLVNANSLRESTSTSLNEQLLDRTIQNRLAAFSKALGKAIDKKDHAVGLLTAVNGKLSTSDIYADPALFRKLYPRLLAAAALEAMSLPSEAVAAPAALDASKLLAAADKAKPTSPATASIRESSGAVQFRFLQDNVEWHRQSLAK
jgi:hypothetical protein